MKLSRELKIGLIMIAAIAALVLGTQYLRGNDIFNRSRTFYSIYNNVNGLTVGSPVTVNGFVVGQVKHIRLLQVKDATILVTFDIKDHDFEFSRDSKAYLESTDIMGSMAIAIQFGEGTAMAQDGDTLNADAEQGLVDAVNAQFAPLKDKTESMITSVDSLVTILNQVMRTDGQPSLEKSFASLSKTMESLESASNKLDNLVGTESVRLKKILVNVESISSNLAENSAELDNILNNFSMLSDTLAQSNIAGVVRNAEEAVGNAARIMEKIDMGEGTLGELINNDSLYHNLDQAAANLDALLEDVRLNPKRYVQFSLIGRKDKGTKLTSKELDQLRDLLKEE